MCAWYSTHPHTPSVPSPSLHFVHFESRTAPPNRSLWPEISPHLVANFSLKSLLVLTYEKGHSVWRWKRCAGREGWIKVILNSFILRDISVLFYPFGLCIHSFDFFFYSTVLLWTKHLSIHFFCSSESLRVMYMILLSSILALWQSC